MNEVYIAWLRGINVGGRNKVKMAELIEALGHEPFDTIKTYIQSGNLVFRTEIHDPAELQTRIQNRISDRFGFSPRVMVCSKGDLEAAMDQNPYPEAVDEPKSLHLYFLGEPAAEPNTAELNALKKESERFELTHRVFYLHAPEGIGRSKLAERVERHLGVATTARNWRTVQKVWDLSETI